MVNFKWGQNTIILSIVDNKYFLYFLFLAIIGKIKQYKPSLLRIIAINKF